MKLSTSIFIFILSIILNFSAHSQNARFQIIHNCPDTIVDTVDVYINDTLFVPGFAYQTAMPYTDVPAATSFDLTITSFGKGDTLNPIFRKSISLGEDSSFIIVLCGQVGNTGSNGFDIRLYNGQEESTNLGTGELSMKFIHSTYDAPVFDVYEILVFENEIIPYLSFGQDSGYIDLDATNLIFQLRGQLSEVIGQYDVDFISFEDSALVVLSTGLYDTTGTAGMRPFGLIAVLTTGAVINLPSITISPARIQIVHNCAAIDAASIDVRMNAVALPLVDDFSFRTATAFIDVPAGVDIDLSICQTNSIDTTSALFRETFMFESGKTYILIASGTIGSGTYNPVVPFSLDVIQDARLVADIPSEVDIMFWHGATDAPYFDIVETQLGAGILVDDISYETYQGYLNIPPQNYDLTIRDSSNTTDISTYDLDANAYVGEAVTILASGFLNPANNTNGPDFGLWLARSTGGNLIPLSIVIGTKELNTRNEITLFPNPSKDKIRVQNGLEDATYKIYNIRGAIVKEERLLKSIDQTIDIKNLTDGMYIIQIHSGEKQFTGRFVIGY